MRYWAFDCKSLISDYEKNRKTLESISKALGVSRSYLNDSVEEIEEAEIRTYIRQLEIKHEEYRMFCDMVTLGLSELPEVERLVLKYWLVDKRSDVDILNRLGVDSLRELAKIKTISLAKFHDIVLPN